MSLTKLKKLAADCSNCRTGFCCGKCLCCMSEEKLQALVEKARNQTTRNRKKQASNTQRKSTERILCAAIWVDTGEAEPPRRSYSYPKTGLVFCGWRHGDCFTTLNAWASGLAGGERQRIGKEQLAGRHQGFLTSNGRFVDRKEAMIIARTAEQTSVTKSELFSEDLY